MIKFVRFTIRITIFMAKFHKIFPVMIFVATTLAACAPKTCVAIPEAPLQECVYMGDRTEFSVWAPGADSAVLKLYNTALEENPFRTECMKKCRQGLWKVTVKEDLKGTFYTFQIKRDGRWLEETAGIAARAVGVNGMRGAVIDWDETDPEGWSEDRSPAVKPSDIIVYELQH